MARVLGVVAVTLALAFGACLYQFSDPAGPVEFAVEDLRPLPSGYDIVGEHQSCGQGMEPLDCGAVVVVAGPPEAMDDEVVEVVRTSLCDEGWRCDESSREGTVTASRSTLFGRHDTAVVEATGAIPSWADISLTTIRQRGRPWVVLRYDSVRG